MLDEERSENRVNGFEVLWYILVTYTRNLTLSQIIVTIKQKKMMETAHVVIGAGTEREAFTSDPATVQDDTWGGNTDPLPEQDNE